MKPVITLLLSLTTCGLSAQWSTDPAALMVIAPAGGVPDNLVAFGDGAGGWFAFWKDKRTDGQNYEVYGQRLDADGHALWEPDGRLIHHEDTGAVREFTAGMMGDGNVLLVTIGALSGTYDTLRAIALDMEGSPIWNAPVTVTQGGPPVLTLGELALVPTSDGAVIGWYDIYFGGASGINVARITASGDLLWEPDGHAIPGATYGPFNLLPDGADGVLVHWRDGNGIGAGYHAMRVDSSGANAWPANVQTNAGSTGFNGNHKMVAAEDASMRLAYVNTAYKVQLVAMDTTGALLFNPSPVPVCNYASNQGQVSMVQEDGITTVVWGDSRPPASSHDVYMQRFDAAGNALLDTNGVPVMHLNTYIPTTGLVPSLNGSVIATIDGNVDGLSAMRMNADGTPAWPGPVAFCTPIDNPSYHRQYQFPDGAGGIVSIWLTLQNTRILGAKIFANGTLGGGVGVAERDRPALLHAYPNPATTRLFLDAGAEGVLGNVTLMNTTGSLVHAMHGQGTRAEVDVQHLAPGLYLLRSEYNGTVATARFMKQ